MKKLKDKVAVITGGTRGIGRAIAEIFASEGATVIITGRGETNSAANEINAQLNGEGEVKYQQCDVSDKEAIKACFAKVLDENEKVDILVNNAGITKDNLLMRMKEDEWLDVINVNLNSLFYTSQAVIKQMSKQRSGCIINIGSVVGLHGNPAQTNYATTKAGVVGFTKSLAKEYGRRGIRANCIAPGFIATDMTAEIDEKAQKFYEENIPLGGFGQSADIAKAALFLAADADYITGQVIQVDGGLFI